VLLEVGGLRAAVGGQLRAARREIGAAREELRDDASDIGHRCRPATPLRCCQLEPLLPR
jgi:hypothetical protein